MEKDKKLFMKLLDKIEEKVPQIDPKTGKLQYLFGGSFSLNILSYVNNILIENEDGEKRKIEFSEKNKEYLKQARRTIHDVDIAVLDENLYTDLEENDLKDKYKIIIDDKDMEKLFTGQFKKYPYGENQTDEKALVFDRYNASKNKPKSIAEIEVDGKKFFMSSPIDLLCYKIPFALRQIGDPKLAKNIQKNESNFNDLMALYELVSETYNQTEISEHLTNILENMIESHREDGITQQVFKGYFAKFKNFSNLMATAENRKTICQIQDLIDESLSNTKTREEINKNDKVENIEIKPKDIGKKALTGEDAILGQEYLEVEKNVSKGLEKEYEHSEFKI